MRIQETALWMVASKFLASRLQQLGQVKVRSTTHRQGRSSKVCLAASGRLMISKVH